MAPLMQAIHAARPTTPSFVTRVRELSLACAGEGGLTSITFFDSANVYPALASPDLAGTRKRTVLTPRTGNSHGGEGGKVFNATPSIGSVEDLAAGPPLGRSARLVEHGVQVTEVGDHQGMQNFAFADPEGRWFAVTR